MTSIRKKLLDFKERLSDRHMYSIVLLCAAIVATAGIYQYKRAQDFHLMVENNYQRAFAEMVDYVDNIDEKLAKSLVVSSPTQLNILANEIWRDASFAQANLGQLPITNTALDNTGKFLAQIGNYTQSLSTKVSKTNQITQEERTQLKDLTVYSSKLSEQLQQMENDMYAGAIKFNTIERSSMRVFGKQNDEGLFTMENVEKEFADYPSLIYDGPFSDHITNAQPMYIKDLPEVTQDEAKLKVIAFLGGEKAKDAEFTGESDGRVKTYNFKVITDDDKREITVAITKQGGIVEFVLDNKSGEKENVDINRAIEIADRFLKDRGFTSMQQNYYQKTGNTVTINYAYMQDNVTVYHDLIKVKVCLEDGDVIGFEAKGYIMNHSDTRPLVDLAVTEEMARSKVNPDIEITKTRLAIIPLESGRESYCWEVQAKFNDKVYLIYVNTQTGEEEKILLLLDTPEGTLTI